MPTKKNIKTPEILYDLFVEYKKHVKKDPIKKMDFKGKDATTVFYLLEKPLSMVGFENFVFHRGLNTELSHYFANTDNRYSKYVAICSRIRGEIKEDQINGGMAGIYNPSITQRLNGLVDKKNTQ